MPDSNVQLNIPSSTGAKLDVWQQANGEIVQKVLPTIGTTGDASIVSSTNPLPVTGTVHGSTVSVSGTVVVGSTDVAAITHAEDAAHATGHKGVMGLGVRKATPANLSGTTGDYEPLQLSAGRLWTSATVDAALPTGTNNIGTVSGSTVSISGTVPVSDAGGSLTIDGTVTANLSATDNAVLDSIDAAVNGTLTVGSHAVTNAGTFAVQEDGPALTALQLIDDVVATDDTTTHATGATKGVSIMAAATPTDGSVAANDIGSVAMSLDRRLHVDAQIVGTDAALDVSAATVTVDGSGVTQPVSGTVTANLSATDNAVLDAIQAAVETIDNAIAGSEMQVDVVSVPTTTVTATQLDVDDLTPTADGVSAALDTSQLMDGLTALTPKWAVINHAVSGDNTLVAAVAAKKIRVLAAMMVAAGDVVVRFEDGAAGTALTGQMDLTANSGFTLPFNPLGWFEGGTNTLLNLELDAAVNVSGVMQYVEV